MNNPLLFTDPSGYRPDLIFEEERRISAGQDFGGGGGGSWNPFGWINRSMSYVGWTDNVGPSRADYDYWATNIRGNAAFGEAANSVGKWYQNRRNLQVNWEIALEMGMEFLSTDYQYGGNDIFYTNSSGKSGYLRSRFAVLVDQIIDRANLSYLESLGQSPRGYGMMLGDPPKRVSQEIVATGFITDITLIGGGGVFYENGTFNYKGKDYGIITLGLGAGFDISVGVGPFAIYSNPKTFNPFMLSGRSTQENISFTFLSGSGEFPFKIGPEYTGEYTIGSGGITIGPFGGGGSHVVCRTWVWEIPHDNTTMTDILNNGRGYY